MKVTINIDCTPQEARAFFGLPDVSAINKAMMDEAETHLRRNMSSMGPEAIMKLWLPAGMQGLDQFQKMFWNQVGKGFGSTRSPTSEGAESTTGSGGREATGGAPGSGAEPKPEGGPESGPEKGGDGKA